jgi:hypothetical protein
MDSFKEPTSMFSLFLITGGLALVAYIIAEIYNYQDIRRNLTSQGIKFETESDTEVLLKYLGNVGFNRLDDLNGMYAFAFYSKSKNSGEWSETSSGITSNSFIIIPGDVNM